MHPRSIRPGPTNDRSPAPFAALICIAVIASCGSSHNPGGTGGGGPLLREAQCMRSHGVTNFPDPSATGGLIIPNDINPQSPAFKSAQQACDKPTQPGSAQGASSESRQLQLLEIAKCMRSHGVPSFSDPTTSPPPPSSGNVLGGNGWYLGLGTPQERQSPAYKRAAAACQLMFG